MERFKQLLFKTLNKCLKLVLNQNLLMCTYVVQPLCDKVPSFCLACLGTNNKFDYHAVLLRWKYIVSELGKRNVKVVNLSSDGDSRLLKAMLVMLSLQKEPLFNPCAVIPSQFELPSEWTEWFKLPRLPLLVWYKILFI